MTRPLGTVLPVGEQVLLHLLHQRPDPLLLREHLAQEDAHRLQVLGRGVLVEGLAFEPEGDLAPVPDCLTQVLHGLSEVAHSGATTPALSVLVRPGTVMQRARFPGEGEKGHAGRGQRGSACCLGAKGGPFLDRFV
jgi:hypothetical protein